MTVKLVQIKHPKIEGTTTVTEAYFERLQAKGWQRVDAAPQPATEPAGEDSPVTAAGELPPVPGASDTPIADAIAAGPTKTKES